MATKGRFGATQLKKELARLAKSAWTQPLALTRYHARWGRIVSYLMWRKKIGFVDTPVPENHPLLRLREYVDRFVYGKASGLVPVLTVETAYLLPTQFIRILILQIIYEIECPEDLYEEIDRNLLYRQFVGVDAELPEVEEFVALVQSLQANMDLLRWLKRTLRNAPLGDISIASGMPAGTELLDAWLAKSAPTSSG